jgi:hypothetical protein
MNLIGSRKYALASASIFAITAGLFTGFLTGGEFLTGITLVLGMYQTANVMEKKQ